MVSCATPRRSGRGCLASAAATAVAVAIVVVVALGSAQPAAAIPAPPASLFQAVYWNTNRASAFDVTFGYELDASDIVAASVAVNNNGLVESNGWNAVVVRGSQELLRSGNQTQIAVAHYAMGFAEGYATAPRIYEHWFNLNVGGLLAALDAATLAWVDEHVQYMRDQVAANAGTDPFWAGVGNTLDQLQGLTDGYREGDFHNRTLAFQDLFMVNFIFEIGDVEQAVAWRGGGGTIRSGKPPLQRAARHGQLRRRPGAGVAPSYDSHCSAVVFTRGTELFAAHNTWTGLESMLRQYKAYSYGNGDAVEFSSYPGTLHSGDDFYVRHGTELFVLETTNANYNPATANFTVARAVSEFIRVTVANALATSGPQWTELFCRENNGAYNNQFMVVDAGRFMLAGGSVVNDTLWVVEQMPGVCVRADQSAALLPQGGYWASYNRPFYDEIDVVSGFAAKRAELGDYFSHDRNYRARIFARNMSDVAGMDELKSLMRFNDFTIDPLSRVPNCTGAPGGVCSPPYSGELSIAARADLTPANAEFGVLGPYVGRANEAAIDAKIIAMSDFSAGRGPWIVSSPTSGGASQLPPFRFSGFDPALRHAGIPDLVDFAWMPADNVFAGAPAPIPHFPSGAEVQFTAVFTLPAGTQFSNEIFADAVMALVLSPFSDPRHQRQGGADNSTVVEVDHSERINATTSFIAFHFEGPSAILFANALAHASPADLAAAGLSDLSFDITQPSSQPSRYWIIGVVVAGTAAIGIAALVVLKLRKKRREEGEYVQMGKV